MWSSSEYFNELSKEDQISYKKKLTLATNDVLPDPYSVNKDSWKPDLSKLPDLSWGDIYNYLVNGTSEFTQEKMKAFKSLEAYNFFVCGHVHDIFINDDHSQFICLKTKVLPSQRQGQKSKLYDVWAYIHKINGYVLTGNCTCMAGLGSVCSHVAALLFKVEAYIRTESSRTACTSVQCQWNRSRKNAEPALLQNINFKRPRKDQLPSPEATSESNVNSFSVHASLSRKNLTQEKIDKLRNIMPNAAYFDSINETVSHDSSSQQDTATAEEDEQNILPEPMTSLFDYEAINLLPVDLKELCTSKYNLYRSTYDLQSYQLLTEITKMQSLSNTWKLHRAGRITASNVHEVMHFKYKNTNSSLLHKLMNYSTSPNVPSLNYGREMEDKARTFYATLMSSKHRNFQVETTGLHISNENPFLGASPDGITSCSCHGKGLVEIKCPYKYKTGLLNWESDRCFPVNEDWNVKTNHPYYAQIQCQLFVLDKEYCDLFIWTPLQNEGNYMLIRLEKDVIFIGTMLPLLQKYFYECLLPEVLTRKLDVCMDNKQKYYCICQRPCFEPMIACDKPGCKIEWYHYPCVNITRAPVGKWTCPNCLKSKD